MLSFAMAFSPFCLILFPEFKRAVLVGVASALLAATSRLGNAVSNQAQIIVNINLLCSDY